MFKVIACGVCAIPIASASGFDNCKVCDGEKYDCECERNEFIRFEDNTKCSGCDHTRHERIECTSIPVGVYK